MLSWLTKNRHNHVDGWSLVMLGMAIGLEEWWPLYLTGGLMVVSAVLQTWADMSLKGASDES